MDDGMEGYDDAPTEEAPQSEQRPLTTENTPAGDGETMHVPAEFLQGTRFKEGDELVLKVVSADDEGLEVAYAKAPARAEGGSAPDELDQLDQTPE